jgi:hypothetical protein
MSAAIAHPPLPLGTRPSAHAAVTRPRLADDPQ